MSVNTSYIQTPTIFPEFLVMLLKVFIRYSTCSYGDVILYIIGNIYMVQEKAYSMGECIWNWRSVCTVPHSTWCLECIWCGRRNSLLGNVYV